MPVDPLEQQLEPQQENHLDGDPIIVVKPSDEWSTWRTNLVIQMFNLD